MLITLILYFQLLTLHHRGDLTLRSILVCFIFMISLVDLRDDGVDIDLPSREEIEGALKYLKNNKAAGTDSIAAELLKNGGLYLVDALHEVIQKTSETLPRSWTEGGIVSSVQEGR
jgi:hypothetical protein